MLEGSELPSAQGEFAAPASAINPALRSMFGDEMRCFSLQ